MTTIVDHSNGKEFPVHTDFEIVGEDEKKLEIDIDGIYFLKMEDLEKIAMNTGFFDRHAAISDRKILSEELFEYLLKIFSGKENSKIEKEKENSASIPVYLIRYEVDGMCNRIYKIIKRTVNGHLDGVSFVLSQFRVIELLDEYHQGVRVLHITFFVDGSISGRITGDVNSIHTEESWNSKGSSIFYYNGKQEIDEEEFNEILQNILRKVRFSLQFPRDIEQNVLKGYLS